MPRKRTKGFLSFKRPSAASRKRRMHVRMHLTIAVLSIAVLSGLGLVDRMRFSTQKTDAKTPINRIIGIEHDGPASLTVVLARKNTAGLVSLENTSNAPVYVSLPDNWNRTEVTNTTIDKVTSSKTQYNFLRWTLPAKAGMKMLLPEVPSSFTFLSPTESNTVALTIHSVDVVDGTKETQVILLQKQAVAKFWTSEASAISSSSSVSRVSSVASSIASSY